MKVYESRKGHMKPIGMRHGVAVHIDTRYRNGQWESTVYGFQKEIGFFLGVGCEAQALAWVNSLSSEKIWFRASLSSNRVLGVSC